MPTVKAGDRVTLKRLPLCRQIPEWADTRGSCPFESDQTFTVLDVDGPKVHLNPDGGRFIQSFWWYKNAIKKVLPVEDEASGEVEENVAPSGPKLYRPSNGTDGALFMAQWCDRCQYEAMEGACAILGEAMIKQPKQWIYGENGEPTCTGFEQRRGVGVPKPYSPSSQTESYKFLGEWCERCEREKQKGSCVILGKAMTGQPEEWVYDQGKPSCTGFVKRGAGVKPESIEDDWDAPPPIAASKRRSSSEDGQAPPKPIAVTRGDSLPPFEKPDTDAEYCTGISPYGGAEYWVAGKLPVMKRGKGRKMKVEKPGEFWYFVRRNGKVTKSDYNYADVMSAARWAKDAIDKVGALQVEA